MLVASEKIAYVSLSPREWNVNLLLTYWDHMSLMVMLMIWLKDLCRPVVQLE